MMPIANHQLTQYDWLKI